jgi:hypothetical protein
VNGDDEGRRDWRQPRSRAAVLFGSTPPRGLPPPPHPPPRARAHVALAGAAAAGGLGLGTVGAGRSVRSEPALMEEVVLLPLSRPSFSSPPLSSAVRAN